MYFEYRVTFWTSNWYIYFQPIGWYGYFKNMECDIWTYRVRYLFWTGREIRTYSVKDSNISSELFILNVPGDIVILSIHADTFMLSRQGETILFWDGNIFKTRGVTFKYTGWDII